MKSITQFFIEAAIRKGAPIDLGTRVSATSAEIFSDFGKRRSGLNYKIEYFLDDDETFTIYGDGGFAYDDPKGSVEGKLTPPHSKTWIRRMIKSGYAPDYAKQVWAEFYSIRHGS